MSVFDVILETLTHDYGEATIQVHGIYRTASKKVAVKEIETVLGKIKAILELWTETGETLNSQRCSTPRQGGPEEVTAAIDEAMQTALESGGVGPDDLTAVGVAVPGVVDPDTGHVVVTPNMNLTGVALGDHLERRFHAPIAIGNDCNLGALGEAWLGSARRAESASS